MSSAAAELGITHGAVSRQIKLLEDWLGQPLFSRDGQRNVATAHARAFAEEISEAFNRISDASVRFGRTPSTRVIRVNAQTTFAMRWLIPRLHTFHRSHPDIEVSVSTANSAQISGLIGFDLLIRKEPLEKPEWHHFERRVLFEEKLTLIAAPFLLQAHPINNPSDLSKHIFVTSQTRPGEWEKWLEAYSIPHIRPIRFQRFDHYHVTLQAVIDGLGLGIGGIPTLSHDIKQRRLVEPFPVLTTGARYVVLVPPDIDKSAPLRNFLTWLEEESSLKDTK
ncbi:DNA-binding transcriptional LysR family regulator [Herbaspirillum sp. Sphag1AN]|nr:DNA-binding transcriptional LysR family regulator [Herbaspirillum sp. Sphag1AN]MBB3244276.1 DNA-binding transcriptional LysR family regulator [Herbaspirillum sp. Sphag64]